MHLFVKVYSPIYNVHTFLYWGCALTSKTLNFITFHYTIRSIWTPYIPYESYTLLFNVRISNTFLILIVQGCPFTCLFFRRPITLTQFKLEQACSIFKRPIAHTHFRLLQACSIFKQLMHLHGSDWANRITITTTDAAATNDKFCSPFCDALYRAILSAGPAFNAGIVYIKF